MILLWIFLPETSTIALPGLLYEYVHPTKKHGMLLTDHNPPGNVAAVFAEISVSFLFM